MRDQRKIGGARSPGDGGATVPTAIVKHLASGEAALILLECLLFRLIERGLFSAAEIVDAIEAAVAAQRQMMADGEHDEVASVAVGSLSLLANSVAAVTIDHQQPDPRL